METIQFDASPVEGQQAIVVSFDLCGFSEFCNHPDAYQVLPRFLSELFSEVDRALMGEVDNLILGPAPEMGRVPPPEFMKYTGDGAILIWFLPKSPDERQPFCTAIVGGMRQLQKHLATKISQ